MLSDELLDFRVLGPVEIIDNGRNILPTAPKPRQVISLLLLRRNAVVRIDELIDELWEAGPPPSAMTTLQTYIYKLRKILMEHGAEDILSTRPGGYMLTVPDASIDLHRFEESAAEGQALMESGDPARAADALRRALAVWRGQALVDVVKGELLSSYTTRLEELRFRVLEQRIEADLQLNRHRELVSELKSLVLTHPLREHLHASLMIALHRSGRRHEALEVYRVLRNNMIEDLGLEPGRMLTELHQRLLSDSPLDDRCDVPQPSPQSAAPAVILKTSAAAPAQLPADVADFTGRTRLVKEISARLTTRDGATATPIAVITGTAGVGKTALAIHVGHGLRPHFQDGQLYMDLHGSAGGEPNLVEVLHRMLRALGVAESALPQGLEESSKLFRSMTALRRLLVVLDDVSSLADVRPLLPGDAACAVIVTSRRRLRGLAGASNIDLDVLDHAESVELLTRITGRARLERTPQAVRQLVELGGRLPLALRCIGSRLAMVPSYPVTEMARQLASSPRRLDLLRVDDLDVRSRYATSYQRLSRLEQSTFCLLSIFREESFTAEDAAELLGWELHNVKYVLNEYFDSHLIRIVSCTDGEIRYAYHQLALSYARERLTAVLKGDQAEPPQAATAERPLPAARAGSDRGWMGNGSVSRR